MWFHRSTTSYLPPTTPEFGRHLSFDSLSPQVKKMKENLAACYFDSLRKRLLRHFEINNGLIIFS